MGIEHILHMTSGSGMRVKAWAAYDIQAADTI